MVWEMIWGSVLTLSTSLISRFYLKTKFLGFKNKVELNIN